MEIENHKEEVPFSHYEAQFRDLDPQESLQRLPSVSFDGEKFTIRLLGRRYAITWPAYTITPMDGGAVPPLPTQTFLLRYLLECREIPKCGQLKTFREMPWGELYIQPFTGRCLTRSAFTFGTRIAAFRTACERLGGRPLPHGDAGFEFDLLGPYSMQIIVWEGDDEFPPNAQLLYTDNFAQGFAAEDRVVAGDILISHIKSAM